MTAPAQEWRWPTHWTEADVRHLPDDGHRYEVPVHRVDGPQQQADGVRRGRHPAYWRVERDGTVHVYWLPEAGEPYKLIHTVRLGDTLAVESPFSAVLDPAALSAR